MALPHFSNSGQASLLGIPYTIHVKDTNSNFKHDIERLVNVIALTRDERMDGERLASDACLSRFHFHREFRKRLGETPGAFRRRLLLERAAFALRDRTADITTPAPHLGKDAEKPLILPKPPKALLPDSASC